MSQSNIVNFSGIAINTANTSNGVTWGYPVNTRAVVDANFVVTIALASTGVNVNTNALDLGDVLSGVPYVTTETINVGLAVSASNNGNSTNAAAAIGYLEHTSSNTDGTPNAAAWAVIPTLGAVNFASVAGVLAANSYTFKLPPGTKRFIRSQVFNNSGASLVDSTATLELLF
jgi:hypothetical protein